MILDCPQCHARFLVADNLIPAAGRTVRCGACAHSWHVENPNGAAPNDFRKLLEAEEAKTEAEVASEPQFTIEPRTPTPNVPALAKRTWPLKPFKIAVPVLALTWAVLAFFAYFPGGMHMPGLSGIYGAFGATNTQGIAFADVKMERTDGEEGRVTFVLTGNIVNNSEEVRTIPKARVELKDEDGKAVWARTYPVNVTLKPAEKYPFQIPDIKTGFGNRVKTITMDLGNGFELMMR